MRFKESRMMDKARRLKSIFFVAVAILSFLVIVLPASAEDTSETKKIQLPKGHKLTFSVTREKKAEKKTKKDRDVSERKVKDITIKGKGVQLPKGHKLSLIVSREKEKKKKQDEATVLDIAGCWKDPQRGDIVIRRSGNKFSATISRYGKRIFAGFIKADTLNLRYDFKDVGDLARVLWTGQAPPPKVLNQIPSDVRHIGFELKVVSEDKLTGNFKGLWVDWGKDSYKLNFAKLYSEPAEWRRAQQVEIKSITAVDGSFNKKLSQIGLEDTFWIKAVASSGCSQSRDQITVTVYPQNREKQALKVRLKETDPNSLEFRSAQAIKVSQLNIKQGDKIIIRSGLRGATLTVRSKKTIAEPSSANLKELTAKKKEIEKELSRVDKDIKQGKWMIDNYFTPEIEKVKQKQQVKRDELLRELRAKNERLMINPKADTSSYDKKIEKLKEEIKRLELGQESSEESQQEIVRKLKGLDQKKMKLQEQLKDIVQEIKNQVG